MSELSHKVRLFEITGNLMDGLEVFIRRFEFTPKVIYTYDERKYFIETKQPVEA